MNQPSRCNTQEGLLSVAQTGWLISWEAEHPKQQIGQAFIGKKPHYQHVTYGLQSDWLHVCKAILLVQTLRATCLQSNSVGTNSASFCSNLGARGLFSSSVGFLLGAYWLAGSRSPDGGGESHRFTETKTLVPAAPHNKTYFSASKTNKKNIRYMNYRHW